MENLWKTRLEYISFPGSRRFLKALLEAWEKVPLWIVDPMSEREGDRILEDLWQQLLARLEEDVPKECIETWIQPIKVSSPQPGELVLRVPNRFFQGWIAENYEGIIKKRACELWQRDIHLTYVVEKEEDEVHTPKKTIPPQEATFNPRYTFESFVVGAGNQFAHAACMAVADEPGEAYNPLFIYGGVGLGKTHLLHAIGHHILGRDQDTKMIYISAEQFMNELIDSIRFDRMGLFRKRFRSTEVLLVDDIQFIAGKDRTQEEFFHTFNELYEAGSQIVISCDRFPGEMERLEERLKSRFHWGLIVDIQPPDLETRIAILRKKAEMSGISIPQDVAFFIARRVRSNVRELEGCLVRLSALSSITGTPITLEMAKRTLGDILPSSTGEVTVERIQKVVCDHFGIRLMDLKSKKRSRGIVLPRQVAMYLSRKLTHLSLPELGEAFGGKDHTSVLHSVRKVEKLLENDEQMRELVEKLEELLEVP